MNSQGRYIETLENESGGYSGRKHSTDEKIRFLKEVISKEVTVNKLYKGESIDSNLFNKCTRDFIETENGRFVHNVKNEVTSFEINHLKNQNILLRQLITELSHENSLLKNRIVSNGNAKASNE